MSPRAALALFVAWTAACELARPAAPWPSRPARARDRRIWQSSARGEGPSYAIYPTQRIPLRFDHAQHLRLADVTCERCHAQATRSDEVTDRLVPDESACATCHAINRALPTLASAGADAGVTERATGRCGACHTDFDPRAAFVVARVQIPPANLRFSHRAHLARGARCAQCHGEMRDVGLATRLDLPTMRGCFACHRAGGSASAACATCHLTDAAGVLVTRFAEGWMNPPEWMPGLHHDADYWINHRMAAADNGQRCANCHRENDCLDCHDGRLRDRRNHPNDYLSLHAADARAQSDRCGACHRVASFCETCHQRMGISLASAPMARATGRFHPPPEVWSGRPAGAGHHGLEARRALSACVSCHSERDCTACHATRGLGGAGLDPHPPGFATRCADLLRASARACAQCHDDLAALAARCP